MFEFDSPLVIIGLSYTTSPQTLDGPVPVLERVKKTIVSREECDITLLITTENVSSRLGRKVEGVGGVMKDKN